MSNPWKRLDGDEEHLRYSDMGDQDEMDVHCVAYLRIRHGARAACKRLRAKVADLEDRLDFSDNGWDRALDERDAARLELQAVEWLTFESPRQSFSFGFGERASGRIVWVSRAGIWPTGEFDTYASAARALGWEG